MQLAEAFILLLMLSQSSASRYNAVIKRFETLPYDEEIIIDFRGVRILGRERALNGTVHILEDMDAESFQMSVDFQNDPYNHGQWKQMIFAVPYMDICSAMKLFIGPYGASTLQQGKNTNLPFDGKQCPLPKGSYYIKNMLMNSESWPLIMPIGALRSNFRFFKHGKPVGGVNCRTDISTNHF